ncbi:MAG: 50S ribosomal protein L24 [Firmicutes bacterium]|nr:50S ribosomal protein L24 [Bacillota bacterium]
MSKLHVKKNDTIVVLAGKDKGKKGKVLPVFAKDNKIIVDGVNIAKKHTKPRPPKIVQGGILEVAHPMNSSKVMLVCSKCNQPTRAAKKVLENGTRERICKKCGEAI